MIKKINLTLIFLFLLTACSPKKSANLEIVLPPTYPEKFLNIPEKTRDPNLTKLIEPSKFIKSIKVGRKDPFSPAQNKSNELFLPESFIYHGQIATNDNLKAFVSYKNNTGTIKQGDFGGKNTNLLPKGWNVQNINTKTETLTLAFEDGIIELKLFQKE